jgi:predicted AAA+ superfamily ATPase
LAEQATALAIVRSAAKSWAKWGHVDTLYYYRTSTGKEVDFVIERGGSWFGIEVKYQSRISGWDDLHILRSIGNGILITKDEFSFGKVPRIPLWAFLLLRI